KTKDFAARARRVLRWPPARYGAAVIGIPESTVAAADVEIFPRIARRGGIEACPVDGVVVADVVVVGQDRLVQHGRRGAGIGNVDGVLLDQIVSDRLRARTGRTERPRPHVLRTRHIDLSRRLEVRTD